MDDADGSAPYTVFPTKEHEERRPMPSTRRPDPVTYDLAIVGAGTAGLATAIEAARLGLRVCLLEKSDRIGGTLHQSAGQMSAAGTRLQRERGIDDDPERHFADVMRISRDTADPVLVRKAIGMAAETIDWLMAEGFEMDPVCPVVLHYHEAYRIARTYWGVDGGRSVLKVLARLFEGARGVDLCLGHAVAGVRHGPAAVDGLLVRGPDGRETVVTAREYVFASGGYGAAPDLFARFTGDRPLFSAAADTSTGDAYRWGAGMGIGVRGAEHYLPTFAGIESRPGTGRIVWDELPQLTPQSRLPWEIFVTRDGARLVREDVDSVDARERALLRQPDLTFWIVFDERMRREAPPLLPGWAPDRLAAAFAGDHPSFAAADSVAGLARDAGIDPAGLAATVAAFNEGVASGRDPLGRTHAPLPIVEPPFRAIRCHGLVLRTSAGLTVDADLRPVGPAGPFGNLRIVGEALGGGVLSGNSFVGGMSVTPALGFGRWIARTVAG
jgi:fumarate reductase flavoprotein subunit